MNTQEIASRYVDLCKSGKNEECLSTLYAQDALSIEAGAPPGMDRMSKGLEAIRAKGRWWQDNNVVHKAEVFGPYPNENRFAVRFVFDVTNKPSNRRSTMDEVALFTVEGEKITREEFFYTMPS